MGACCSAEIRYVGRATEKVEKREPKRDEGEDEDLEIGECGASVRLRGSSKSISMYTQQGRKGINQDAVTVWENFIGDKDSVYCGVFDGHGPSGHNIARQVRHNLPAKLSLAIKQSLISGSENNQEQDAAAAAARDDAKDKNNGSNTKNSQNPYFQCWESSLGKAFKEMDEELSLDPTSDSYCSGTTAVNVIKQGDHLIVANLGDSRAVLCTRGNRNQLVPVQLTTDMKPNISSEVDRIKNCKGRVFAMEGEPDVFRVWMPDEDCPGLAMTRAFGDFCLKDYGLISIPEISCRKITNKDEFVVLATDGVWDVLSNNEVIRIVACARKRSTAARTLIHRALQAWRSKYPASKIDDCAVVCLFLKDQPIFTKSLSASSYASSLNHVEVSVAASSCKPAKSGVEAQKPVNGKAEVDAAAAAVDEWSGDKGLSRANTLVKIPRIVRGFSQRKTTKNPENVDAS